MAEQKTFLSSQGTEVNKNSTSYTNVVSPLKKKKKKEKKIKKGSGARLGRQLYHFASILKKGLL